VRQKPQATLQKASKDIPIPFHPAFQSLHLINSKLWHRLFLFHFFSHSISTGFSNPLIQDGSLTSDVSNYSRDTLARKFPSGANTPRGINGDENADISCDSTNLIIILGMMQVSKRVPFDDPFVLNVVRAVYLASNVIIAALYFYTQLKINKKKGTITSLKQVKPA
jgi:hypothetical protein